MSYTICPYLKNSLRFALSSPKNVTANLPNYILQILYLRGNTVYDNSNLRRSALTCFCTASLDISKTAPCIFVVVLIMEAGVN